LIIETRIVDCYLLTINALVGLTGPTPLVDDQGNLH